MNARIVLQMHKLALIESWTTSLEQPDSLASCSIGVPTALLCAQPPFPDAECVSLLLAEA